MLNLQLLRKRKEPKLQRGEERQNLEPLRETNKGSVIIKY